MKNEGFKIYVSNWHELKIIIITHSTNILTQKEPCFIFDIYIILIIIFTFQLFKFKYYGFGQPKIC